MSDSYTGTWDLVPELCLYDEGAPPEQATYDVSRVGSEVRVEMTWRPAGGGETRSTGFAGPDDGEVQAIDGVPGVTGFSITRVDERTLDSAAWNGTQLVSSARRVASADGDLLVVVQSRTGDDGRPVRTYQVYRRRN